MDIHEIINRIYRMPEASADKVVKHLSKVTYPKGYHILEAGKTETNIFFIEKGIARAYIPVDGKRGNVLDWERRVNHCLIEKLCK